MDIFSVLHARFSELWHDDPPSITGMSLNRHRYYYYYYHYYYYYYYYHHSTSALTLYVNLFLLDRYQRRGSLSLGQATVAVLVGRR